MTEKLELKILGGTLSLSAGAKGTNLVFNDQDDQGREFVALLNPEQSRQIAETLLKELPLTEAKKSEYDFFVVTTPWGEILNYTHPLNGKNASDSSDIKIWEAALAARQKRLEESAMSIDLAESALKFLKEREETLTKEKEQEKERKKALKDLRNKVMKDEGFPGTYLTAHRGVQNMVNRIIASEGLDKDV